MLCAFSHLVSVTELTTYRSSSAGANRNRVRGVRTGEGVEVLELQGHLDNHPVTGRRRGTMLVRSRS